MRKAGGSKVALGVIGLAALLLAPSGPMAAAPCAPLIELPGVGPACPRDGGYDLVLPDGSTVFTHGPDPVPPPELATLIDWPIPAEMQVAPVCIDEDFAALGLPLSHATARGVLIYARPFDRPNNYATMAPEIREMAIASNTLLFREGLNNGVPVRYRMLCDDGELVVLDVALPTPKSRTSAGTIFGDLQALGFTSRSEKYWVWYDGFDCWCGGIGTIDADERLHINNFNNAGPDWGITFGLRGFWGWFVMMHENGHNLGVVGLNTPQASGGFHCNDGWDVMCYADGGPKSRYNHGVCGPLQPGNLPRWDCRSDDYFNTAPEPETYLFDHWQAGTPLHRWIAFGPV